MHDGKEVPKKEKPASSALPPVSKPAGSGDRKRSYQRMRSCEIVIGTYCSMVRNAERNACRASRRCSRPNAFEWCSFPATMARNRAESCDASISGPKFVGLVLSVESLKTVAYNSGFIEFLLARLRYDPPTQV
jgi:hypothetical protein